VSETCKLKVKIAGNEFDAEGNPLTVRGAFADWLKHLAGDDKPRDTEPAAPASGAQEER